MFEIELCTFTKDYEGFWLNILNIDNGGDFDRALFTLGKREDTWFLDLFFIRLFPR